MMKKVALFTYNSDPVAFAHALLNAIEMRAKGWDAKVIVEGETVKFVSILRSEIKPFADVWRRARDTGAVACVCRTCAHKAGIEPAAIEQDLPLCAEANGHPSMATYMEQGYEIVVV